MRRGGFTLIEIITVLAILAVVMGPLDLMEQKLRAEALHLVAIESAHQDARQLLLRMQRAIRSAHTLTLSPSMDGVVTDGVRWQLKGGYISRDGQPASALTVRDLVLYREGRDVVITLQAEVDPQSPPFTMVARIKTGGAH